MIDHIGLTVADLDKARAFYLAALQPLGIAVVMEVTEEMTGGHGAHLGFGRDGKPDFWIADASAGEASGPNREVHFAFQAADTDAVTAFHDAAVELGAESLHAPRLWPEYHPGYFGAFVRDPDGNNVEAVFHGAAG